ncbi:MAG: hypothetical protein L0Z50_27665 [Verrucomicrobiales bacterium]|nr:hypothetical protein [Verrucomicrobiales bacterium]
MATMQSLSGNKQGADEVPTATNNEPELVTLYADQIASVAKRVEAGENVAHELEEVLRHAVADFGRTEGVSQTEALRALAKRLDQIITTATPAARKVFATAREMALHHIQDPGDLA